MISVTSRRLVRGMKVDHKKRRGEGLRVFGGEGVGLSLVGRRQASTDKLEFLVAVCWRGEMVRFLGRDGEQGAA